MLERLLPGSVVTVTPGPPEHPIPVLYEHVTDDCSVALLSVPSGFSFWLSISRIASWTFAIERLVLPFTKAERKLFSRLPRTLMTVLAGSAQGSVNEPSKLGALLAFEHLLVAQLVRGETGGYWSHLFILQALADLTFVRYETARATSGIVYSSQPELYLEALPKTQYRFSPFRDVIPLSQTVFHLPAAHRYVDGRNSFYLIDNRRSVLGILRSVDPTRFSMVERCGGAHCVELVREMPGRTWVAYLGYNDDVHVRGRSGLSLRWHANHWHSRDEKLLTALLVASKVDPSVASLLSLLMFALSDLRRGALVLIPDDSSVLPPTVGSIDRSALGDALREQFTLCSISDLQKSHTALAVLSSDGLTTIDRSGSIISCGQILQLDQSATLQGGGRTHAARIASKWGMTLKVSQDGPITVFHAGKQIWSI